MLLKGRLILDCSSLLPGPYVGKLLAERGARVIKIENPDRPDPARLLKPDQYQDLNRLKELLELDIASAEGKPRFHELVRQADGLIEAYRPLTKKKLGLDAPTLHAINPRLCVASLVGYPEDSPWRDRAGHDLNFQAVTGVLSLSNEMPALPLADLFAAQQAALSLACALDGVARGAPGARVVTSMSGALRDVQEGLFAEYRKHGRLPKHGETLFSGRFPCYRIYEAGDGTRVAVGAIESKFWLKACAVLGLDDLEASDGFETGERGREVIAKFQRALGSKSWQEWASAFDAADCCVEPVLDASQVPEFLIARPTHGL